MSEIIFLCLLLALASPGETQYPRVQFIGNLPRYDTVASHPLAYWTEDPRNWSEDFSACIGCKLDDGHVLTKDDYKVETEVHNIGSPAGYTVLDIIEHVSSKVASWASDDRWRLVLIETSPRQFAEIYLAEVEDGNHRVSRIVKVGDESVLATYDPYSGTGGLCTEGYWWFDSGGPHPLIFTSVYEAIAKALPKNAGFNEGCWSIDLDRGRIWTFAKTQEQSKQCNACGELGSVTANFVLDGAMAVPTKVEFAPTSKPPGEATNNPASAAN